MATTFAVDIAAGIKSTLDAFKVANPTYLRSTWLAHPPSLNIDLPAAWIETQSEAVVHDSGTRTRTMTCSVVLADRITDNVETMGRIRIIRDALLDAFTAVPQFASTTIWDTLAITDELDQLPDGSWMQQTRFTFGNISIMEGRS